MRRILVRLGEDATFTHGTAQGSSVRGVFTSPYMLLPAGLDAGFAAEQPRFAAMSSDLAGVALSDTITRGTQQYRITNIEPQDPAGVTVLALQEA